MDILILNYPKNLKKKAGELKIKQKKQEHKESVSVSYYKLNNVRGWREMFLNSYNSPFLLYDKEWNSIDEFMKEMKVNFSNSSDENDSKEMRQKKYNHMITTSSRLSLFAKFSQNEELKRTLVKTLDAELCYIDKDFNLQAWDDLMEVRKCINTFSDKSQLSKNELQEVSQFSSGIVNMIFQNPVSIPKNKIHSRQRPPKKEELQKAIPSLIGDLINTVNEYVGNPFTIVVNVPEKTITIPNIELNSELLIDWGDGITEVLEDEELQDIFHEYEKAGEYVVRMNGEISDINFQEVEELIEISHWGNTRIGGSDRFYFCKNLISITAEDAPNLLYTDDLSRLFSECEKLNRANLNNWDVSGIYNMESMFSECKVFNSDLSNWDVSNVTDMSGMFSQCENFSSNLSKWNTSNVTDMNGMFEGCYSFNSDLSSWDVSNVQNMEFMFSECKVFDSDLSNWDVSKVQIMDYMFAKCSMLDCDLSKWNTSYVNTMIGMFEKCISFKSNIASWDTSRVSRMSGMFKGCKMFNSDLSNWDVSNVTRMENMFQGCISFNSELSNWNVINVINMDDMFNECKAFNSDISKWNVGTVRSMTRMFKNCQSFNSDIGNWDVYTSRSTAEMFMGCSSFNQDLSRWELRGGVGGTKMFGGCPILEKYKPVKGRNK